LTIDLLWYLFIYSFFGWCTEVIYAATTAHKFVNRGFLNGPYCPIYGIGVIIVLFVLEPLKNNIFFVFIGSILITSIIELMTGILLKEIFHQKWWDYSDRLFNIGGYICLLFSLGWGLACLVVVDKIHPLISTFISWIPETASKVLLVLIACLFVIDLLATVESILKLNKRLEIIDEISFKIRETSDHIGENLAYGAIILAHKKEATPFGQERLLKAFPSLKSLEHKDALDKLRNLILDGLGTSNGIGDIGETEENVGKESDG
jgi:uncharacterized membrane protein